MMHKRLSPLKNGPAAAATAAHPRCCWCDFHGRRLFTGLLVAGAAAPVLAQQGAAAEEGLRGDVGRQSRLSRLVPAEEVEAAAAQQYNQMMAQARQQRALAPDNHPQVRRLRTIAERIVPHALPWNDRARRWRWEINLLGSDEVNAFCMPGGKIAFYFGILSKLQLTDAEVAAIMGHEVAHALREHARERMAKTAATQLGANALSAILGLGGLGDAMVQMGGQLLTLRFSREDETEADLVGLDLSARAGYDPGAGVTLWQKMIRAGGSGPLPILSTHPPGDTRIRDIQSKLPKVEPLYRRAEKPPRVFGPPQPGR